MLTFKFILNTLCRKYKHPRYWPLLSGVIFTKILVTLLPPFCLLYLGQAVGWIGFYCAKRRRAIAVRNIQVCFPMLSQKAQIELVRDHFSALGRGVIDTAIAWLMPKKQFDRLVNIKIVGESYLAEAEALRLQRGVIFLSPHLTSMELLGRYCGHRLTADLVYQKHRNPLFEEIVCKGRDFIENQIERREVREMVRNLKAGHHMWYSTDQDLGPKVSVFVPFFGTPCATSRGLSWLCKMTNPVLLPVSYRRLPGFFEYELKIYPPLENIPSGDEVKDAAFYNQWLEQAIRANLPDYFWIHRRFKTRPEGEPPFYSKVR